MRLRPDALILLALPGCVDERAPTAPDTDAAADVVAPDVTPDLAAPDVTPDLAAPDATPDLVAPDAALDATTQPDTAAAPDTPAPRDVAVPDARADVPAGCTAPATWTCTADRSARQRCANGALETVRCASGCVAGAGEAVCSCGAMSGFTVWNCLPSGDLGRCQGGAWLTRSCMGNGCAAMPVGVDDVCRTPTAPGSLQAALDRLGPTCATASPGTRCAVVVRDLATGERGSYRGGERFQSASSAKAMWVAAAVLDRGVAPVEPYATPVFRDSDNDATGRVIDLLASPARVNTFYRNEAGMTSSSFCRWNTSGVVRQPANCVPWSGANNYVTGDDAVEFLARLAAGRIVAAPALPTLLGWMTRAPRTGSPGGVLGTQLPAAARATMRHKAGWIPDLGNHNDIGLVEYAPGRWYAVAILTTGAAANFWTRQSPWIEYASCVVYHAVARDVADPTAPCRRP